MNRQLPLLFLLLAVPLRAQEDGGGDEEQQTASPAPATRTTGDDGGPNAIGIAPPAGPGFGQGSPTRRQTQPASLGSGGGSGGGGGGGGSAGGGRFGSRPTTSAYGGDSGEAASTGGSAIDVSKKRVLAAYEHHSEITPKQMSYGVFRFLGPADTYSTAIYTGTQGGRMEGHYCTVVKGASGGDGCGWQVWLSEKPGGKALCSSVVASDVVEGPPSAILTKEYGLPQLKKFLSGGSGVIDLKGWCLLKPETKYYCNISIAVKPSSPQCIGLKASSPYDTHAQASIWQASRPH